MDRLARNESVLTETNSFLRDDPLPQGNCAGGKLLPPNQAPTQPPEPLKAPGARSSVDRPGGNVLSPAPVSERGTSQRMDSRPGKVLSNKFLLCRGVTPKRVGRLNGSTVFPKP